MLTHHSLAMLKRRTGFTKVWHPAKAGGVQPTGNDFTRRSIACICSR
jgi:hypothetical protein